MFEIHSRNAKTLAVLTGGVMMASFISTATAPAQAADKEKVYKGGAVALGVLGAYWVLKGKTVPGAAAAAGAYYAYKKGQDINDDSGQDNDRNRNNRNRNDRNRFDFNDSNFRDNNNRDGNFRDTDYNSRDRNDNDFRRDGDFRHDNDFRHENNVSGKQCQGHDENGRFDNRNDGRFDNRRDGRFENNRDDRNRDGRDREARVNDRNDNRDRYDVRDRDNDRHSSRSNDNRYDDGDYVAPSDDDDTITYSAPSNGHTTPNGRNTTRGNNTSGDRVVLR